MARLSFLDWTERPSLRWSEDFFADLQRAGAVTLTERQQLSAFQIVDSALCNFFIEEFAPSSVVISRRLKRFGAAISKAAFLFRTAVTSSDAEGQYLAELFEDRLSAVSGGDPLPWTDNVLATLWAASAEIQESHPLKGKRKSRKRDVALDDLILKLADLFEAAGGKASASYQKHKGERETPFLRFLACCTEQMRDAYDDYDWVRLKALKSTAIRERAARVLRRRKERVKSQRKK